MTEAKPKDTEVLPLVPEEAPKATSDATPLKVEELANVEAEAPKSEEILELAPTEAPKAEPVLSQPAPQHTPSVPETKPSATEEEAPDPDEDDLSDLDDVLDEFAAVNINKSTPPSSGPGRPFAPPTTSTSKAAETNSTSLPDDDEFARSLQAGMAELLGELEGSPEMRKQFEELVKELGDGVDAVEKSGPSEILGAETLSKAADLGTADEKEIAAKAEASFQETIRATMERMSASNTAATSATQTTSNAEDDFLAAMLREMEAGSGGPGGGDEDFSKMLLGMMEQLTNKDILYEPMKELHDKFPPWLEVNREKTPNDDLERYEEQQRLVGQIVGKFEESGYADEKVEYREFIVDKMQKMQAAGSPPPDLVGDMNAAQEAMGAVDEGCAQQ